MTMIAYIARGISGTNHHGSSSEGTPSIVAASGAKDISLNLTPSDISSYARYGQDLHIQLADGTTLVLSGYYDVAATGEKGLFLSDDGAFIEVQLEDKAEGMLFTSYEPLDLSGKWSAYDDLVFLDVERVEPVVAPLVGPALGGLGAAAAGAAVIGGAAVVGGGSSGGGGSTGGLTAPTVNDPEGTYVVAEGDTDGVTITGTGEAGSTVEVTIGTATQTTTVAEDGSWSVDFPTTSLPADGSYETVVDVVAPDGTTWEDIDGPTITIDTDAPTVDITTGTQSVGDIVDGDEQSTGTIISGTGEAGATVTLEIDGETQTTTVAEDGTWSVTFSSEQIATGEYETEVTITTTDPYGNSTTTTDVLEVDTQTTVSIDTGLAGGDDIATAAEVTAGVEITGDAEAGASVSVTIEGVTRTTTADASGQWSVTFEDGTLPEGEYDTEIAVTSTDLAGNTATATSTISIDTDAGYVTLSSDPIETDDVINAAERSDGVTINGTATPGEEVTVTLGTASGTVIADADGNWSYEFAASDIPEGSGTLDVTATISDDLGNTEQASDSVALDTEVTNYTSDAAQTSDDIVNLDELNSGFTLAGTVEAGSSVQIEIEGQTYTADVDADGNWSLDLDSDDISDGDRTVTATITATDEAGNVSTLTQSFDIDTEFDTPEITGTGTDGADNLTSISVEDTGDTVTVETLETDGTLGATSSTDLSVSSSTMMVFDDAIADGTNLVVTTEDDAGNSSSTLVLFDDNATESGVIDHAGLTSSNIDSLNLEFAADTDLTLTEADINALSGNSDTLTVTGGSDDTVRLAGATAQGSTTVDGTTYNAYTIGDGDTQLLVDEDVNVVI